MLNDLKTAFRSLRRRPGLTVAATLTLALGIGATTTIYSVVQASLLEPLPYQRPAELVQLIPFSNGQPDVQLSFPDYKDIERESRSFAALAPFRYYLFNLAGSDAPESVLGVYAGAGLFPLLGIAPAMGRQLGALGDEKGHSPEALLTNQLWRRRYGADPSVVGRSVTIDGRPVLIAGVLPAGFRLAELTPTSAPLPSREPDIYLTIGSEADSHEERGNNNYWILGRLAPGVTAQQANADMARVIKGMAEQHPDYDAHLDVRALSLKSQMLGESRQPLFILLGAVALLLLIACANVAGLLAARAADRQRETALRAALGAGRWALARQVITESLVLAILGGGGGILVAAWGIPAFRAVAPNSLPRLALVSLDWKVLGAALGLILLTAVLAGLPSAFAGGMPAPAEVLKEGGRGSGGMGRRRIRRVLTSTQVAISMVLLCGAGLLFRSLLRINAVEPGYDTSRVLTMMTILPQSGYSDPASWQRFHERAIGAVATLPGVEAAGGINTLPLSNLGSNTSFEVVGEKEQAPGDKPSIPYRPIGGEYFKALRIPLVAGRNFLPGDTAGAPLIALVNQALVRKYFPTVDPIGRAIHLGNDPDGKNRTIIGVLGDTRDNGLDSPVVPMIYYPLQQGSEPIISLTIKTIGEPRAILPAVQKALAGVDPSVGFFAVRTMDELLEGTLARRKFNLDLLAGFAIAALLLSAVGLYGVIAYSATQRSREIGIRMALGAAGRSVTWLIFREGLVLVGFGAGIGLVTALAMGRILSSQLYGVGSMDPIAFGAVALVLAGVASL
ncbi:MAG TPA: ABC transporter permease, partial [Gemmatimonadales bacterium]|nr:ABC transporter permease [Gemmatimonadales bacterium]